MASYAEWKKNKYSNSNDVPTTTTHSYSEWKKNKYSQNTEADKENEKPYDTDAGAKKIERLKYYSGKAKELNDIMSTSRVNGDISIADAVDRKAMADLQKLYEEYEKEFSASPIHSTPTTVQPNFTSGIAGVNAPAKPIDFDSLLAEEQKKYDRAETKNLYGTIIADPNYEVVMKTADETPAYRKGLHTVRNRTYVTAPEGMLDTFTSVNDEMDSIVPSFMTEEERTRYKWLWGNGEYDKAEEFYQSIKSDLEERAHTKAIQNTYQQGKEHPGFTSAQAVVRGALAAPAEAVADTAKLVKDTFTDPNNVRLDRNQTMELVDAANYSVSEDMSPAGRFLYNTAMSGAQSLLSATAFGKLGGVAMALSAAGSAVNDGLDRGMTDIQAMQYGIAAGVFEGLFETWSIGHFIKEIPADTIKVALVNIAKSMGVNASEEWCTEVANIIYDTIAHGELSRAQQMIAEGKTKGQVIGELALQTVEAAGSGALMGAGFSSVNNINGVGANVADAIEKGKEAKNKGITNDLIDAGMRYEGTEAYKLAEKASKRATNYRVGRLSQVMTKSAMQSTFAKETGNTETAKALTDIVMGKEVGNSDIARILSDEKSLSALNNVLGTNITSGTSAKEVKVAVKESVGRQTDDMVDSLREDLREPVRELVKGNIISDSKIEAVLKDKTATAILSLRTGIEINDKTTAQDIKEAVTNAANDHSRARLALVYAASLDMGENGAKGVARMIGGGSSNIASAVQAYNAVYRAGRSGKSITEAKNPYLSELTLAERMSAYEYGLMDSLSNNPNAEYDTDKAVNLKGGEVATPVKNLTRSQQSVVDAGKTIGVNVVIAKVEKNGKNIDGLFDGETLYINPDPNSGNPMFVLVKHELTHFTEKALDKYADFAKAVTDSAAFAKWLRSKGYDGVDSYLDMVVKNYKDIGKNYEGDAGRKKAHKEMVANFVADTLYGGDEGFKRFTNELSEDHRRTLGDIIRDFIDWVKKKLGISDEVKTLEKRYAEVFKEAKEIKSNETTNKSDVTAEKYVAETKDTQYNYTFAEEHKKRLEGKITASSTIPLETLMARYDKILEIWNRLGGQLNSKFMNEWNSKQGKDRAFTVFKAQSGYKYNVELSSMCKKGVPLFEAIDTIVKSEAMKELKVDKLGKAEKETLYDLLKSDGFDIPCAICYVEQARQREGVIIDAFLHGTEDGKIGWNSLLHEVEDGMRKLGVDYTFPALDRSVATDKYVARKLTMTEAEQDAFYKALKEIANREITKYNEKHVNDKKFKPRRLVTSLTTDAIADCFKGNISADIKIFKVLFLNPNSRFTIESDLLYASTTTHNLAYSHQNLYSLFNQQGGVSGYKTKQSNVVYWGDILEKKWEASKLRKEGGIRYQSNSDSQMYTLLDQVQMFIDLTAKGFYLQSYTKVLSYIKLLGLSKGKINASLIPKVVVYRDANGDVDVAKTQENAGLDENGNPIYDDFEGINHAEAFMLLSDPEYSKNVGGVCIGYSDNHIRALLDDSRIQLIIGFHDKTNNPDKRYRGARYSKNYNGINEAVDSEGKTVHIGFNQFVQQAEKMFTKSGESFTGTATYNGKEYKANDIPRLAADLYLDYCAKKKYSPAYNIEGIVDHPNYYKLLADFSLYDSKGNYAPHQKVEYNMPDQVPYLDENGHKRYMKSETYIRTELEKELKVRDDIAEKLADKSDAGLIPRFIKAVNGEQIADAGKMVEDDAQYSFTPKENFDEFVNTNRKNISETEENPYSYTPEKSTRDILASMMDTVAESDTEKRLLAKYKSYLKRISDDNTEIASLREQRKNASKAQKNVFSKKIGDLQRDISDTERRLSNLEKMATIKRLVEVEREKLADEAHLAGQMAQGRQDAKMIRNRDEKIAEAKAELQRQKNQSAKDVREAKELGVLAGQMAQGRIDSAKLNRAIELAKKRYAEKEQRAHDKQSTLKVKRDIAKVVKKLDELLRRGTKDKHVHFGLQDAVASALEIIDINAEKVARYNKSIADLQRKLDDAIAREDEVDIEAYTAALEKKRNNFENFSARLDKMRKAYEDIRSGGASDDVPTYYREEAKVIEDVIKETIEKIGGVLYEDMNIEQLEQIRKMYKMILTTVQNANKVFRNGKLEDLVADATAMEHDLDSVKKLDEERWKFTDKAREFIWNELTPYYAFSRIGSQKLMEYYWDIVRGQDTYARDTREASKFAKDARKKYGYNKWDMDKVYTIKDKNGKDFRLTLKHMMSIYAYSKREQAEDHMSVGGFFFNDSDTFVKKGGLLEFVKTNEQSYKVDKSVVETIVSTMDSIDKNIVPYVDTMQDYLTKMGEKGNEVTREMWGINVFKEKHYFPLKSKEDFIYQANTPAETSSLKNDGMTKETKPHASNPIVLEAFDEVWDKHVEKMSKYHAFVIPIDNLNKLINYGTWAGEDTKSISLMLSARFGNAVNQYLNNFIKDLNGAKAQSTMGWAFATNLVNKFKKTAVAASMSVVVQQPTAVLRALSEINVKYFMHLPGAEKLNAKWDLMQEYAPIVTIKEIGGFDSGSGRSAIEVLGEDRKKGLEKAGRKIDDLTMYGAALGDRLGWASIWNAVEEEISDTTDYEKNSKEFYEAVGKRFTEVIVKTQVYDSTLSRSGFMRGKDGLIKMAMAFKGEPTLSFNMLFDAVDQARRGKISKKQAVRSIAAVYSSIIAATLAKSLIYALRDEDEDESYIEKYFQAVGGNIFSDTFLLSMLPLFSDVMSIIEGYDVERSDMAVVADLVDAVKNLDSESRTTYRKIEDLAGAMGGLIGVPVSNIMRTFREGYNVFENIFDGVDFGDVGVAFKEGLTGKEMSKSESLHNAIMNNDTARIEVYRKSYKDEDAYKSALKKSLRENDPRVVKSVEQALLGNYTMYNNSKRSLGANKRYGVKLVNDAFADEREYVLNKLEEARKARKARDMDEYNKIIDALVERGYSRPFITKKLK